MKKAALDWLLSEISHDRPDMYEVIWDMGIIQRARYKHNEQIMDVIEFMRRNNKMDKSVEDLYQQYIDEYYSV
jgi:hypothetical protein